MLLLTVIVCCILFAAVYWCWKQYKKVTSVQPETYKLNLNLIPPSVRSVPQEEHRINIDEVSFQEENNGEPANFVAAKFMDTYGVSDKKEEELINAFSLEVMQIINKKIDKPKIRNFEDQYNKAGLYEDIDGSLHMCMRMESITKDPMKRLLMLNFIRMRTIDNNVIDYCFGIIKKMSTDKNLPAKVRMNATDMLLNSNDNRLKKDAEIALNILRAEGDNEERPRPQRVPTFQQPQQIYFPPTETQPREFPKHITERSIYGDSQNVHTTALNESMLAAATKLAKNAKPNQTLNYNLIQDHPRKHNIEKAIHRIKIDPMVFGKDLVTLKQVFDGVLTYISEHPQKEDLEKRLVEELDEMADLCSSGHCIRLVNSIQGFDTPSDLGITVSNDEEIYASIKHKLDKAIQESEHSDDIIESMISKNKNLFLNFVNSEIRKIEPELEKEYNKNISSQVQKAVKKYTRAAA